MCPKPLMLVSMTGATLFRLTHEYAPTLLMDEHDALTKERTEAMRDILDAGHRKGAVVPRVTSGARGEVKLFKVWGPKAIARIGLDGVSNTVLSRSLKISMKRQTPEQAARRERVPHDLRERLEGLRQRCTRWAADNATALTAAQPAMPYGLGDRAQDNWRPLLAIADLCGAGEAAREAAVRISGGSDRRSQGTLLLSDIRDYFDQTKARELSSADIVQYLIGRDDREWSEVLRHGRNREQAVAKILRPYGISPVKLTGGSRPQGYRRRDFVSSWKAFVQPRQLRHSTKVKRPCRSCRS
jgi:putative DNA primase/helicase